MKPPRVSFKSVVQIRNDISQKPKARNPTPARHFDRKGEIQLRALAKPISSQNQTGFQALVQEGFSISKRCSRRFSPVEMTID